MVISVAQMVPFRYAQMAGYCIKFEHSRIFAIFVLGYSVPRSVRGSDRGNLSVDGSTIIGKCKKVGKVLVVSHMCSSAEPTTFEMC